MNFASMTPNFEVSNVKETVNFYVNVLGFSVAMAVTENREIIENKFPQDKECIYAFIVKDNVMLAFQRGESLRKDINLSHQMEIGASIAFYIEVQNVDELYNDLLGKINEITDVKNAWYGMREFYFKDINGYLLGFGSKI